MKNLCQILGLKKAKGDFGIEIECEGAGMEAIDNAVWRSEDDGSLRGVYPDSRCEYIFQKPLELAAVKPALEGLLEHLEEAKPLFSFRTSVHVHCNVQELTYPQILNVVYTYLLLEEPLATFCGRTRKGNQFALRLADAEGFMDTLQRLFREGEDAFHMFRDDHVRYAALNLCAMGKYGSIEFRGMRGTLEMDVLLPWVNAIYNIREYAKAMDNPADIFAQFAAMGPQGFISHVLKEQAQHFFYPKMIEEMQRSFSITIDLPYAYEAYCVELKRMEEEQARMAKELNLKVGQVVTYKKAVELARKYPDMKFKALPGELDNDGNNRYRIERLPVMKAPIKVEKPKKLFADLNVPVGWAELAPVAAPDDDQGEW